MAKMGMHTVNRILLLGALVAATASCGDVVRQGRAPVYLVLDSLTGSRGNATPGPFVVPLISDVITNLVTPLPCAPTSPCPTIFNDSGQAVLRISLKDIGPAASPTTPTTNHEVTITRVRIVYVRTDGRNTPGVDVPHPFDSATTGTVPAGGTLTLSFLLVRHNAKEESPLVQLRSNGLLLSTYAEITFYGKDQVGNDVSVTGTLQIEFGNFGDG